MKNEKREERNRNFEKVELYLHKYAQMYFKVSDAFYDDLMQTIYIRVLEALDNYNGVNTLATFVKPYAHEALYKFVRENLHNGISAYYFGILKQIREYHNRYGYTANTKELSAGLHIQEETVKMALYMKECSTWEYSGGNSPQVVESAENQMILNTVKFSYKEAISMLPEREREVIVEHYWNGKKLSEIASAMGVKRGVVIRLRKRALDTLRTIFSKKTKTFSDTEYLDFGLPYGEDLSKNHVSCVCEPQELYRTDNMCTSYVCEKSELYGYSMNEYSEVETDENL